MIVTIFTKIEEQMSKLLRFRDNSIIIIAVCCHIDRHEQNRKEHYYELFS